MIGWINFKQLTLNSNNIIIYYNIINPKHIYMINRKRLKLVNFMVCKVDRR